MDIVKGYAYFMGLNCAIILRVISRMAVSIIATFVVIRALECPPSIFIFPAAVFFQSPDLSRSFFTPAHLFPASPIHEIRL